MNSLVDTLYQFALHLGSTLTDILPIIAIIFGFQLLVIRKPIPNIGKLSIGFIYVLIGLALFMLGLDQALFPLGRLMATQLTEPSFVLQGSSTDGVANWHDYHYVYLFAFLIGFSTTIAEPSLIAVAMKANQVSGGAIKVWGLRVAAALGVAIGITLGCYRIVVGDPIHFYIIAGYILVVIQTAYAPKRIIPLAYDSGGVTTSTVTVPLVAALGLGLAENIPGRNPIVDGFGLIAFASLFPIITVMAYGQLAEFTAKYATYLRTKRSIMPQAKVTSEQADI